MHVPVELWCHLGTACSDVTWPAWPGLRTVGARSVLLGVTVLGGGGRGCCAVAEPGLSFAGLLRQLRTRARLTQEELAEAAGVSPRSVSDLERGINRTARKDTALLLADALSLTGQVRVLFVAAARGRAPAVGVFAAGGGSAGGSGPVAAAARTLPRDIGSFTGREAELN